MSSKPVLRCKACNKKFVQETALQNHVDRFHTRPFACSNCTSRFASLAELTDHQTDCKAEKPYACKHCPDEKFLTRRELTAHEKTHLVTTKTPAKCPTCKLDWLHMNQVQRDDHKRGHAVQQWKEGLSAQTASFAAQVCAILEKFELTL